MRLLWFKETEIAIVDENMVQEISKKDKSVHLDPSEKSTKNISQGNVTSKCHLYVLM